MRAATSPERRRVRSSRDAGGVAVTTEVFSDRGRSIVAALLITDK